MRIILACTATLLLASCHNKTETTDSIPVIGLNQNGKSTITYIPKHSFKNNLSLFINKLSEEVTNRLETHETSEQFPWTLSRVTVGLGLEAEFEVFDEMLEAEVESDIEFRFQKMN